MATSKEKVKAVYPNACHSRHTSFGGDVHYLIWSTGSRGYTSGSKRLGEGKTQSAAWVAAAKRLPEKTSTEICDLGVGCEQAGVCYAEAHQQPEKCGRTK